MYKERENYEIRRGWRGVGGGGGGITNQVIGQATWKAMPDGFWVCQIFGEFKERRVVFGEI